MTTNIVQKQKFDHPIKLVDKKKVEAIISNCPERRKSTLNTVCKYFRRYKGELNDFEKAWLVYRWIALNISYDVEGFLSEDYGDLSARGVFRAGKSVCSGYSELFRYIAFTLGLEVFKVRGWAKGGDYDVEALLISPNHEWNAVALHKTWHLVDATWGAGSFSNGRFTKDYDEYYFCPKPPNLVRSHFPEDPRWQLASPKVRHGVAVRMLRLSSVFYQCGFVKAEPDCAILKGEEVLKFKLYFSDNAPNVTATLKRSGRKMEGCTFVQKRKEHYEIQAALCREGRYDLVLFACVGNEYSLLYEYRLICTGSSEQTTFPGQYYSYNELDTMLYSPKEGSLKKGSKYTFKLGFTKKDLTIAVVIGDNWHYLKPCEYTDSTTFEGNVEVSEDYVGVYAKSGDMKNYATLVEYTVS